MFGVCDNIQREEASICHQYNQWDHQVTCSLEGRGHWVNLLLGAVCIKIKAFINYGRPITIVGGAMW